MVSAVRAATGIGKRGVAVSLSIAPPSQTASGSTVTWSFSAATVTVTGGTATAYAWTMTNQLDGAWTIPSGAATATATGRVASVLIGTTATADMQVDVTVGGVHYFATAPMSYTRS